MDITFQTSAKVQIQQVEITMSTEELFIQLCHSLKLNPNVILKNTGTIRYILLQDKVQVEEDISRHGSRCWKTINTIPLTESERKRYEALKALYQLI